MKPSPGYKFFSQYYVYAFLQPVAVAANGVAQDSIIMNTFDFIAREIAVETTSDNLLINFRDNNQNLWFNVALKVNLHFTNRGANRFNLKLCDTRYLWGKQTITMELQDLSGAPNNVYCSIAGSALYPNDGSRRAPNL